MSSEKASKPRSGLRWTWAMLPCVACLGLKSKHQPGEDSLLYVVLVTLSLHGPILIATATFLKIANLTWSKAFGFSKPPVWRSVLFGAVATLLFIPVGMVLQMISIKSLEWLHFSTPQEEAVKEFDKVTSLAGRIYLAFFAIILAPFIEEVFFRGTMFGLLKRFGLPRFALWFSAFCFAAIHLNAPTFLPLFVFGLVLAWLYARTDNLLSSITAHAFFNALNVALLLSSERLQKLLDHYSHLP